MGEEKTIYTFSYLEIAAALVKKQGLHNGLWGVYVEFGLGAANIPGAADDPMAVVPTAIIPIKKFNEHVSQFTVDAAEVNPAQTEGKDG